MTDTAVREVKTADEIELLKVAAGMVDATYVDIAKAIHAASIRALRKSIIPQLAAMTPWLADGIKVMQAR